MTSDIYMNKYFEGYSTTKNKKDSIYDLNISYPILWYLDSFSSNYGINENYNKDNFNFTLENNYHNHIPFIISSQNNIDIGLDLINDFTLSFWFSTTKTFNFNLTADGTSAYIFNSIYDRKNLVNGNNPDITIYEGDIIVINNNTGGHPFKINNAISINNQQSVSGGNSDTWKLNQGNYTYVCTSHPLMTGNIIVIKNQFNLINTNNLIINTNNQILNINQFNCNIQNNNINHILLNKSGDIYYNNKYIINLELTDITEINLGSNINYTDIRLYDFNLDNNLLFNIGDNIKLNTLYEDNLINYHHYNKKVLNNFNLNLIGNITLTFWIYTDNQNNNLLTFDNFNFGIKNNRFFVKTFTENIIYGNKKLESNHNWYFISISIQNRFHNHIVSFYQDNFPVIKKIFKNLFYKINSLVTINLIFEDIKIYNKILNINEILDLYITGIKLNNVVKILPELIYDYKTDNDFNLNINGINKIEGNNSKNAYQWNNPDKNYFMSINNSSKLFNKFYNGFEISITYWTYIINSTNVFNLNNNEYDIYNYDIHIYNTNKTILKVYQTNNNLIQGTFNILENNFKLIATTEKELENNKWYLVSISGGIKNNNIFLNIDVYDKNFDGRKLSYISGNSIKPILDNYDYSLNNDIVNLDININKFGDINIYNKLIDANDIYHILNFKVPKINQYKKLELINLSNTNEKITLINNNIQDIKYSENSIQSNINLSDYYKIEFGCSYSKKDLNVSENITDIHIYTSNINNTISNLIKFGTNNLIIDNTVIDLNFQIENNVWYDYYFTLKYEDNNTFIDIYQSSNLEIINHYNYNMDNYILFNNKQLPTDIRIGIAYDENPTSINKIIENLKFHTKKFNKKNIQDLLKNNLQKINDEELKIWYKLQDNKIKDSSKNYLDGIINGNLEVVNLNSYDKAIKIVNLINGFETPVIKLNKFTLMIKINLNESTSLINIINYNNLNIKISSNEIKIYNNDILLETSQINFINNWKTVVLIYDNNKLFVYIDAKIIFKNIDLIILDSLNKFKLMSDIDKNININLKDFRIYSKIVSYETIYKYI